MFAYDARVNQFVWFNRAYAKTRQNYLKEIKEYSSGDPQYRISKLGEARNFMLNNARRNQHHLKIAETNLMKPSSQASWTRLP